MAAAGIICEYNPFHNGHLHHMRKTRETAGGDCAVVCVMSGNFTQRGDFAVFSKHARAEAAVRCGADLVVELPVPYVLSSAEGFAEAGVYILDALGVCDYISFGSETGDLGALAAAAEATVTGEAEELLKKWLGAGLSYASARQRAAESVLGARAELFKSPNNLLGIEYLKAITRLKSKLVPLTVKRERGEHDGRTGWSASAVRWLLPEGGERWQAVVPPAAVNVYLKEIADGCGPVSSDVYETAMLSRLRAPIDFSKLPGAVEGLDRRFMRYAASEPTVAAILEKVKTKRYAMSRLRRMLLCACLGIEAGDTGAPPPYIRVLAMNGTGMALLKNAKENARLPIITKPASAKELPDNAAALFRKESAATDFYALGMPSAARRSGGGEYRESPRIVV